MEPRRIFAVQVVTHLVAFVGTHQPLHMVQINLEGRPSLIMSLGECVSVQNPIGFSPDSYP